MCIHMYNTKWSQEVVFVSVCGCGYGCEHVHAHMCKTIKEEVMTLRVIKRDKRGDRGRKSKGSK